MPKRKATSKTSPSRKKSSKTKEKAADIKKKFNDFYEELQKCGTL